MHQYSDCTGGLVKTHVCASQPYGAAPLFLPQPLLLLLAESVPLAILLLIPEPLLVPIPLQLGHSM